VTDTELSAQLEAIVLSLREGRVSPEGAIARACLLGISWWSGSRGPGLTKALPRDVEAVAANGKSSRGA
jgi:hypothetical protein